MNKKEKVLVLDTPIENNKVVHGLKVHEAIEIANTLPKKDAYNLGEVCELIARGYTLGKLRASK